MADRDILDDLWDYVGRTGDGMQCHQLCERAAEEIERLRVPQSPVAVSKISDAEFRMECLRLAQGGWCNDNSDEMLKLAKQFFDFVKDSAMPEEDDSGA